jgi:hypothetical protein
MRSKRKGSSTPWALLVGLGLPVLALFGLFSLVPYDRMTAQWPLGISAEEVHLYQRWFDQRPDTMAEVEVQRFDLDSSGTCKEGSGPDAMRRFSARGYADSALVGHAEDAWILTFPDGRPFRAQHAVRLTPASMSAIRALYAREVAHVYGLAHGSAELVRLWSCGDDQGLFLSEETIDQRFVDREGRAGASLVDSSGTIEGEDAIADEARRSARSLIGSADRSRIDENAAAVWGVVGAAVGYSPTEHGAAWFDPATRAFLPALGATVGSSTGARDIGRRALAFYVSTPEAQRRMSALATTMRQDSAELEQRLADVDASNASAFVGDTRIGYVRAQLGQERKEFLHRLFHPDTEAAFGLAVVDTVKSSPPVVQLDPLLRRYLVGDTVRFPRAKHLIDHVITVPAGIGVVLEKGARLNMAPGSGLVVNGSLHMRGTGLNPVFIRPAGGGAAWAGICVNGTGSTRCVISGLKMSGGSMLKDEQGDHIAMLSFHGCKVSITSSAITGAQGPSAIAIERGALEMRDCFIGTGTDGLLDVAFAEGSFTKCSFHGEGTPVGARAKGAQLRFDECAFSGFRSEGISLRTRSSAALRGSVFSGNGTAVVGMDGSEAFLDGCVFSGNTTAIDLYRSKAGQPGGKATVYHNTFTANGSDKRVDEWSTWTAGTGPMPDPVSSATKVH